MRAVPADFRLLLPKGWPEHIRSAGIHVISLTHFSATFARSVAASSINARIRLKTENSRLRQEIALVIEEARIKDSRMDRIPATPATIASWTHRLEPLRPKPRAEVDAITRIVTAKRPNHVWHVDLCAVPISSGFWTAWLPWALPQRWPFCWWVAVAGDHLSRRVTGFAVFEQPPTSADVAMFLGRVIRKTRATPKHLITDRGKQFISAGFGKWCRRKGIHQRVGAIGKYGSLAVVERLIRSINDECTRRLIIPYRRDAFRRELTLVVEWFNGYRPHTWLAPRFEPRTRWPRRSRCAAPQARVRGRCGVRLELHVSFRVDRKHLPVVELRRAA